MFATTLCAPAGTSATPATVTARATPDANGVEYGPTWVAGRESSTRAGGNGWKASPTDPPYQPVTSTTTSAAAPATSTDHAPPAPTGTVTWFATTWPDAKFNEDTPGQGCPAGQTDTKPAAIGPPIVTFATTTAAPAGTSPTPATETAALAAPYEEIPRLDLAAVAAAEGHHAEAQRIIRDEICNRTDDDNAPPELPTRTEEILRRRQGWTDTKAS